MGALAALALAATPAQAADYTILGDWVIGPSITFANNSDNITVFGDVIVQGTLALTNCTLNITYVPVPPPPQVPRLGNLVVTGTVWLLNSTVTFDVGLGGSLTVPNGFRVSSGGSVFIRDLDNNPATPYDASRIEVTQMGSHSTFGTGTHLSVTNSFFNDAGWESFPGLELTGTVIFANGAHFTNRPTGIPAGFSGVTVIRARSGTSGSLGNSTFNGTGIPGDTDGVAIDVQGCPAFWVNGDSFEGFRQGVVWSNGDGAYVYNLTFSRHGTGVEFSNMVNSSMWGITSGGAGAFPPSTSGWPPDGALTAVRNSRSVWITDTRGDAALAAASFADTTLLYILDSQDVHVSLVTSDLAVKLGVVDGSSDVWVNNVTATNVADGLTLSDVGHAHLDNLSASGPGGRLRVVSSNNITLKYATFAAATGIALFINSSEQLSMDGVHLQAEWGLSALLSSVLALRDSTINASESGMFATDSRAVTLLRVQVVANQTGVEMTKALSVTIQDIGVVHGYHGIDMSRMQAVLVANANLTSISSPPSGSSLWLRDSTGVTVSGLTASGSCYLAARLFNVTNVLLQQSQAVGCQQGMTVLASQVIEFEDIVLTDIQNGSGLELDTVVDTTVTRLTADNIYGSGLSVSASRAVQVTETVVTNAGGVCGLFFGITGLQVTDSEFSQCGSAGVSVWLTGGAVSLRQVAARDSADGVYISSTPNVTMEDIRVAGNTRTGLTVDSQSPNAVLHNITASDNGRNGIYVETTGVTFVDGNFSSNGWDAIATGPGIRLPWLVEVAASITDDSARLPGDLTVAPGATFRAVRATLRPDSTPISPRTAAWNVWSFGVGSTVLFNGLTVDAVNSSAAYTLTFANGSHATINGSQVTGAGRDDARSLIIASFADIAIHATTITGFYGPLEVTGGTLLLEDVLVIDNHAPVSLMAAQVTVSNLTVQDGDGDGVDLMFGGSLSGDRLSVIDNGGVGLRVSNISPVVLTGLTATGNQQGAASFADTSLTIDGLYFSANAAFALSVARGASASVSNLTATLNAGPGLRVTGTASLQVTHCRLDRVGGHGLQLESITSVRLTDCTVVGSGGFGLTATDVTQMTGRNLTFDRNAVSQVFLSGQTSASFRFVQLHNSPGDAVLVRESSSVFLEDLSTDSMGGVLALESGYAYLLNATFGSDARAQGNAEIDIAWKVHVQVVLEDGSPGASAAVQVWGTGGALLANASTDDTGWTPQLEVLEETLYGTLPDEHHAPHDFNATMPSGASGHVLRNITANDEVTIRLDNTVPVTTLALDGPEGLNGWFVGPVTVTLETQDAAGAGVTLWWRATTLPSGWTSSSGSNGSARASFTITAEGRTIIEFYAVDAGGNVESIHAASLRIDTLLPVVELAPLPAVTASPEVNLTWEILDSGGSGNLTFLLQVQTYGGPWTDLLSGTTDQSFAFVGDEGSYTFRLVGTDEAGHESGPSSGTVQISLHGALLIHVVDRRGVDVPGATVALEPTGRVQTITGALNLSLAPGAYRVVVTAPGYNSVAVDANVTAGGVTDTGPLVLDRFGVTSAVADTTGLALLLLLLAVAAGAAWVYIRNRMGPPKLGTI